MTMYQRVAIYWTPEDDSPLDEFGKQWFGALDPSLDKSTASQPALLAPASITQMRNTNSSATRTAGPLCSEGVSKPVAYQRSRDHFGLSADLIARAIKDPARYTLHATMKAPFRIADGFSVSDIDLALSQFCSQRRSFHGGALRLKRFQRYLGLVPDVPTADIDWLAAECVTSFDQFRAPLAEADHARRTISSDHLTEAPLFKEFGYPYVLSAFQFHVSLAGPLTEADLDAVEHALAPHVKAFAQPFRLESLALLGEPEGGGLFKVINRHKLR